MKKVSVICVFIFAFVLMSPVVFAADDANKPAQQKDTNDMKVAPRPFELNDEMIDRFMARLTQNDAEKAKELEKLRKDDPAKFRDEIGKLIRERRGDRGRSFWGPEEGQPGRPGMPGMPVMPNVPPGGGFGAMGGGPGGPGGPENQPRPMDEMMGRRGWFADRIAEYQKWLKENYPNEANKLEELQKKDPELYQRQAWFSASRYWRIFEASKDNPELANILKQQLELNDAQDKLLDQIKKAADDKEKKKLVGQLKEVLDKKYDLIVAQKENAYKQLQKRLEGLKKHIEESQANVEKWHKAEYKKGQVDARLKELVGPDDNFKWD
jgi:hypothetical protein